MLFVARICHRRWPDELWIELSRFLSSGGDLRWSNSKGGKASRPTGNAADQIRVGPQSADREEVRPVSSAQAACSCRRGDRIAMLFAAVHEPGVGTSRT